MEAAPKKVTDARDMGVGRGGVRGVLAHPRFWNLTFSHCIFNRKGCFLTFEKEKWNIDIFGSPSQKYFWLPLEKSTLALRLEKIFPGPWCEIKSTRKIAPPSFHVITPQRSVTIPRANIIAYHDRSMLTSSIELLHVRDTRPNNTPLATLVRVAAISFLPCNGEIAFVEGLGEAEVVDQGMDRVSGTVGQRAERSDLERPSWKSAYFSRFSMSFFRTVDLRKHSVLCCFIVQSARNCRINIRVIAYSARCRRKCVEQTWIAFFHFFKSKNAAYDKKKLV